MQNELDLTPLTAISPLDGRYAAKLKPLIVQFLAE